MTRTQQYRKRTLLKLAASILAFSFILSPFNPLLAQEEIPIPGETQNANSNPDVPVPGQGITVPTPTIQNNSTSSTKDVTTRTVYPSKYFNTDGTTATKHIFANGAEVGTITGTGAEAVPRYVHIDHLTGSNIVTNSSGTIDETLDYFPFGGIRIDSGSYSDQRKYIGQEYDTNTGLSYLNARYYDGMRGQFLSQDPMFWQLPQQLLIDPQQQNSYSYARNNPINLSDPSGLLTAIAPGSFTNKRKFSSEAKDFIASVGKTFGEKPVILDWSGKNNKNARLDGANTLVEMIKNHKFASGEKLNIVGHSHGGNVAILASQMTDRKIDNLVTLGTPVRSDYQPNYNMIGTHINAYSNMDPVQIAGGQPFGKGNIGVGFSVFGSTYGFIPAGRKFYGAENIGVTKETGLGPKSAHSDLWRNSGVWAVLDSEINE